MKVLERAFRRARSRGVVFGDLPPSCVRTYTTGIIGNLGVRRDSFANCCAPTLCAPALIHIVDPAIDLSYNVPTSVANMNLPAAPVLPRVPSDSDGSSEHRGKPIGSQSSSWNISKIRIQSPGVSSGTTDKLRSDLLGWISNGDRCPSVGSRRVTHDRHEPDLGDIL